MALTTEQRKQEAEKFMVWLRRKFPAHGANVRVLYRNTRYLRGEVAAYVYQYGNLFKVEVAVDRDLNEVLRSVAHEYEHVRQVVNERIPLERIKSKQEMAAWGFAIHTINMYIKEHTESNQVKVIRRPHNDSS